MSADEPLFLDVEDVIELHTTQLDIYGGLPGLRDRGLLESAVAQPQTSFGGAERGACRASRAVRTARPA